MPLAPVIDAVHQFVASYVSRDAIGTHVREARRVLHGMGLASDVYAGEHRDAARGEVREFRRYARRATAGRALLLYQLSTGSPVAEFVLGRPEPKLVNYHNVTPAELFAPWEPSVGAELEAGRRQLAAFAAVSELGLAVSGYNEGEMIAAGFRSTAVGPVLVDLDTFDRVVDQRALEDLRRSRERGGARWLFVGRVAPNKAQHDLVKAFAAYRELYDPRARLYLVGGSSSHAYWTALERFVRALGLQHAVQLTGSVPSGVLAAHYRAADVFVCLSDHEGFCVPLLEAMHNEVPIVAYAAAAVPETLGGAGVVLPSKNPATVATAVHRVVGDDRLRGALVTAGRERLQAFSLDRSRAAFRAAVEKVLVELR